MSHFADWSLWFFLFGVLCFRDLVPAVQVATSCWLETMDSLNCTQRLTTTSAIAHAIALG